MLFTELRKRSFHVLIILFFMFSGIERPEDESGYDFKIYGQGLPSKGTYLVIFFNNRYSSIVSLKYIDVRLVVGGLSFIDGYANSARQQELKSRT